MSATRAECERYLSLLGLRAGQQALDAHVTRLGADHIDVAPWRVNLAYARKGLGEHEAAREQLERARGRWGELRIFDELGLFEHPQVLHHGDAAHLEVLAHIIHAAARHPADQIQDLAAMRAGQSVKNGVHRLRLHK